MAHLGFNCMWFHKGFFVKFQILRTYEPTNLNDEWKVAKESEMATVDLDKHCKISKMSKNLKKWTIMRPLVPKRSFFGYTLYGIIIICKAKEWSLCHKL